MLRCCMFYYKDGDVKEYKADISKQYYSIAEMKDRGILEHDGPLDEEVIVNVRTFERRSFVKKKYGLPYKYYEYHEV